jgi:hypothetical protein
VVHGQAKLVAAYAVQRDFVLFQRGKIVAHVNEQLVADVPPAGLVDAAQGRDLKHNERRLYGGKMQVVDQLEPVGQIQLPIGISQVIVIILH